MIPAFVLHHRTKVRFGQGVVAHAADEVMELAGTRALVVCDQGIVRAGIAERVVGILEHGGVRSRVFSDLSANPRDDECAAAADEAAAFAADVVVGLGGGSPMDVAKTAAVLVANGGRAGDWESPRRLDRPGIPLVCIPTTAGTGSEVTYVAVITDTRRSFKMSVKDPTMAPRTALVDPQLTRSLPAALTASTGMDALTHAVEAFTCRAAEPITDVLALEAVRLVAESLPRAVRDGADGDARSDLMLGSLMAGIAFGNTDVGGVHCMAEAIGGLYDTPHGLANAVLLAHVLEFNLPAALARHARIAEAMGVDCSGLSEAEAAGKAVEAVRDLCRDVGIPRFRELDRVDPGDFENLARAAALNGSSPDNAREIGYEDYLALFRKAYSD